MDRSILAGRWHGRKTALVVALAAVLVALFAGAAYATILDGTPGDDTIHGTAKHDDIFGRDGNDTLYGEGSTDTLNGNRGDDTLYGGAGADILRGYSGDDELYGGSDDTQGPHKAKDTYYCGTGYDVVHVQKAEHSTQNIRPSCEEVVKD